jgi:hypothetical protein
VVVDVSRTVTEEDPWATPTTTTDESSTEDKPGPATFTGQRDVAGRWAVSIDYQDNGHMASTRARLDRDAKVWWVDSDTFIAHWRGLGGEVDPSAMWATLSRETRAQQAAEQRAQDEREQAERKAWLQTPEGQAAEAERMARFKDAMHIRAGRITRAQLDARAAVERARRGGDDDS